MFIDTWSCESTQFRTDLFARAPGWCLQFHWAFPEAKLLADAPRSATPRPADLKRQRAVGEKQAHTNLGWIVQICKALMQVWLSWKIYLNLWKHVVCTMSCHHLWEVVRIIGLAANTQCPCICWPSIWLSRYQLRRMISGSPQHSSWQATRAS